MLLFHGIGSKLIQNWEQNIWYVKVNKFYIGKEYRKRISTLTGLKVSFSACKCLFYRPEPNLNGGPHEIDFWKSWNAKMEYTNGSSSKRRWKNGSFVSISCVIQELNWKRRLILCHLCWWQQKISHSFGKIIKCISLSTFKKWCR